MDKFGADYQCRPLSADASNVETPSENVEEHPTV